jgi:hypothetical protein
MTIKSIVKKFLERVKCRCACFTKCNMEIVYNASMRKKSKKNNNNENNENTNTNINNVVVNNPNNEGRALPAIPREQNIYVTVE